MIILRHDVDDAFPLSSYFSKGLNYLSAIWGKTFTRLRSLGFLRDALNLFEREKEIGITATWFFRTLTRPFPDLKKELLSEGHEIGFHADRIENRELFKKDLEYVAQGTRMLGFSKHGNRGLPTSAGLGLGEVYNLPLYVKRAKEFGFLYFAGNDVNPVDEAKIVDGVVVFPSAFWIAPGYMDNGKFTVDWLIKYQKDHDVVVLIHPTEATEVFPERREKFEKILNRCEEIVSFKQYLKLKRLEIKLLREFLE